MERGTVLVWHALEGWGAISSEQRSGTGFVHQSSIKVDGPRTLHRGQVVEFEWADDFAQDGCQWRVKWVRSAGEKT